MATLTLVLQGINLLLRQACKLPTALHSTVYPNTNEFKLELLVFQVAVAVSAGGKYFNEGVFVFALVLCKIFGALLSVCSREPLLATMFLPVASQVKNCKKK